jgi:hypothetical protein
MLDPINQPLPTGWDPGPGFTTMVNLATWGVVAAATVVVLAAVIALIYLTVGRPLRNE